MKDKKGTEQTLNIEYHTKLLVVKALNKTGTVESAAHQLGTTERSLYRWLAKWRIHKNRLTGEWYYIEKIKTAIHATNIL